MKKLLFFATVLTFTVSLMAQEMPRELRTLNGVQDRVSADRTPAHRAKYAAGDHDKGLVLLVQYEDLSFKSVNGQPDFDSLMNAVKYTYDAATGSVREYFRAQSLQQYNPHFDVVGPITLPGTAAHYGRDDREHNSGADQYTADFVMDACFMADTLFGVDFSQYDADQDGVCDFVYLIYAGYGTADGGSPDLTIWPHSWDLESALAYQLTNQTEYYINYDFEADTLISENLPVFDGVTVGKYACSNCLQYGSGRRNGIGTIAHEFSHVLGLPDYYITRDGVPMSSSSTPGSWSTMSYACYQNDGKTPASMSAFDRYYLGWHTPTLLCESQEKVNLSAGGKKVYMVTRDGLMPADGPLTQDTIYYIEYRTYSGWDQFLPGNGMLIWRVVYDSTDWYNNEPNNYSTRVKLIAANGSNPYSTNTNGHDREDVPFPGLMKVDHFTFWPGVEISDITPSTMTPGVSFRFTSPFVPSGMELNTSSDRQPSATKRIENGQLVIILPDGRRINAIGQ